MIALVLMVAGLVGAYAHANGHASPTAGHVGAAPAAGSHCGHIQSKPAQSKPAQSKPAQSKPGHIGQAHDCDDGSGTSPIDCCDTICHGGQAILATSVLVPHPALDAPLILSASAFHGAEPGGLDRPPKPFRQA